MPNTHGEAFFRKLFTQKYSFINFSGKGRKFVCGVCFIQTQLTFQLIYVDKIHLPESLVKHRSKKTMINILPSISFLS